MLRSVKSQREGFGKIGVHDGSAYDPTNEPRVVLSLQGSGFSLWMLTRRTSGAGGTPATAGSTSRRSALPGELGCVLEV